MSTRTEELRYLWRLDLADDVTGPLLQATREQERALAVQEKALKKVGDTSGRVSATQKAAAKTVADAAQLRAREAGRAADREVQSLTRTGRSYRQLGRDAQQAARQQEQASRRAQAALRAEQRTAQGARDDIRRAGRTATAPVRTGATALTAAAGFGVGALVANYVSFEKQLSRVRAVTQATDDQFKQLQATALDLGQKTQFNNREVAGAMTELATAGFTVNQIIGTLPGTLDLASATGYDLAASAELQASTLRAFGLAGKDATKVADVLTNTANKSAVGMDDLGESLSYIAPVAKTFNQSMEDVLASVGILGNVGIKGSQAGTTVRTALTRLAAPSKKAKEALDELGISTRDLYGPKGMRPLPEIIGKIVKGTDGMKKSQRDAALVHLFGREALAGMLKLVDAGEGKYRSFSRELDDSRGAAKRSADVMRDNVAGSWDQFTGSVESAAAALLTKYSPAVKQALTDSGDFVDGLAGAEPKRTIRRDAQGRVTGVQVKELNEAQRAGKEFAKTLGQINDGAQDIIGPLGQVAGAAADIGKAHPWIVKTVGALVALRVAWKLIKITSAGTGLTGFLRTLNRVGGADGVGLGGRIIGGIRSKISSGGSVITGSLRRVLGRAGTAAGETASAATAEALADNLPASVRSRRDRFRGAGRIVGGIFAAGAATVIGVKIGEAIEDALDPKHHQDKFDEWSNSALPGWLRGIQNARQDAADWLRNLVPGGRKGGVVGRFQDGGMVPVRVSSGEEVHHAGRVWTVPGSPTAADNVFTMLPAGAGVLTFDGQDRMAAGASLSEAIATQAPHFQNGGVVRGKVSTFGPPLEPAGTTATGSSSRFSGVAVRPGATFETGRPFLNGYWQITIAGHTAVLKQTDLGPHENTGRRIDVTGAGARQLRLSPERFPTDQPGVAKYLGKTGRGHRVAGEDITVDEVRTLARNSRRQGILPGAFEQGISAGQAGQRTPGILSELEQAAKVTKKQRTFRGAGGNSTAMRSIAANTKVPYVFGGGHAGFTRNPPNLDCSGYVSHVLHYGGADPALTAPLTTQGLARYGKPGAGKNVTVYVRNGGAGGGHTLMKIGERYYSSGNRSTGRLSGRFHPPKGYLNTFPVRRHPVAMRAGGIVPRRDQDPLIPLGMRAGGTVIRRAVTAATNFGAGSLANLDQVLADAVESRLLVLKSSMLRAARKGGDERVVKRYQSIVSLIDGQLGVRIGRIQAGVERRGARTSFATDLVQRRLRGRGVAGDSTQGLQITATAADQFEVPAAKANLRDARIVLRKAERAGASTAKIRELQQGVTDAIAALDETLVAQIERRREIIRRQAQDKVDDAQFRTDWNSAGLAFLDASQRVQGTAGTSAGMIQRAGAIKDSLPGLQALQTAFDEQAKAALRTGDFAGFRQGMLAAQQAATDLANAQADAGELIKQAAYQQVQDAQDAANFTTSVSQARLEGLGLQQQTAGTFDTASGRQQRSTFIRDQIIPGLQRELAAAQGAIDTARAQDGENSEAYRQAVLKALGLQNEIARDNLDATQLVAENTEPIKEFTGSSAFENRGQSEVLGLLAVGSGA